MWQRNTKIKIKWSHTHTHYSSCAMHLSQYSCIYWVIPRAFSWGTQHPLSLSLPICAEILYPHVERFTISLPFSLPFFLSTALTVREEMRKCITTHRYEELTSAAFVVSLRNCCRQQIRGHSRCVVVDVHHTDRQCGGAGTVLCCVQLTNNHLYKYASK